MKRVFGLLLVLSMIFMAAACGTSPSTAKGTEVAMPPWVNDTPPEDVLWGIGTAKQTSASMSITTAENRGRVDIARQIDSKIQAMFIDYNLDAGNVNNLANSSMQESISRTLTNTSLSGARRIRQWSAPDGTIWALVEYKKSDAKNTVASILGNEEAQYAQFKANQALQMMDAQFDKPSKPTVVTQ